MLTVDVEDYFQVSAFDHRIKRDEWESMPCRVEANTERLLAIFSEAQVSGTFFVLGWVANKYPKLIRRIAEAGHELASHGYWHRLVYTLSREEFRRDIKDSKNAIGDATGVDVTAYRAPSFSITNKSLWALETLVEEGFEVDSSIFPIRHDRYGVPDASPEIHSRVTPAGSITEIPPSFWHSRIAKVPIGGGYFRLFPESLTSKAITAVRNEGRPAMFYLHPWEIDPEQPRISDLSIATRFRHYVALTRTEEKLRNLLSKHTFTSIRQTLPQLSVATPASE
ncbi:DUF3473 domain-containing protein [Rhodopirellula sp.]|nr:DUF3473 domain-containing protein [Rhodopirellula sp.]